VKNNMMNSTKSAYSEAQLIKSKPINLSCIKSFAF
jgi:hypothetical protein